MKYYILINQLILSETDLDIIDGAILDYIYFYCNSQNEKVKKQRITDEDNEIWTWIDYETILKDMPMLHFKSIGIITLRINKIENAGYIKTKRFQHIKKYFRMTAKSDGLFIQTKDTLFNLVNSPIQSREQVKYPNKPNPIQSREPIKNKDKIITSIGKTDKPEELKEKEKTDKQKKSLFVKGDITPISLKQATEYFNISPQKHIRLIGTYAAGKKPNCVTSGQWWTFMKRNLQTATELAQFSDEQIMSAFEKVQKSDFKMWTLETLLKYILNNH